MNKFVGFDKKAPQSTHKMKNERNSQNFSHFSGAPETTEIEPELYIRKRVCGFYR